MAHMCAHTRMHRHTHTHTDTRLRILLQQEGRQSIWLQKQGVEHICHWRGFCAIASNFLSDTDLKFIKRVRKEGGDNGNLSLGEGVN